VEGVVGLIMIIGGTVLAVLLLVNVGAAAYNKEKIGLVANQAATYACILPNDATRQPLVATAVDELLSNMGLNPNNTVVDVQDVNIASEVAVKVTVTATIATLLSGNFTSIMPAQLRMSDSALVVKDSWYWGYGVGVLPTGQKFTGPIFNPTGALPNDGLPAYGVSLLGMWKIR
jgi:hypothetical protein